MAGTGDDMPRRPGWAAQPRKPVLKKEMSWSALSVLGVGSVVCALAPSMEILLVGRAVQGGAGGLVAGLGYAVINAALPQSLWIKASALVSAMWGVGILLGPAIEAEGYASVVPRAVTAFRALWS